MAIGQGVPSYDPFTVASGGVEIVSADWMPASDCRSLVREDPCALWLDWYGDQHGFTPAVSDYSFNDFVFRKGKELEAAWLHIYGDHNVRVCQHDGNARLARNLKAEINSELIEKYRGTISLPFEPGPHKRVAVKVIDDRGIESVKVVDAK